MSLYVIGDLHLSFGCDKQMDVFGGRWENYTDKLLAGFSTVKEEDTTVIAGDLSWGMNFADAKEDFLFIHRLPGKKIILKGNHDYWWTTVRQAMRFFEENGIEKLRLLNRYETSSEFVSKINSFSPLLYAASSKQQRYSLTSYSILWSFIT